MRHKLEKRSLHSELASEFTMNHDRRTLFQGIKQEEKREIVEEEGLSDEEFKKYENKMVAKVVRENKLEAFVTTKESESSLVIKKISL